MKPFRVVGANRADIRIPIELPFDAEGEWAFDGAGKPVRGHKPVVIELPRFEFIPPATHKAMVGALEEIGKKADLTDQERAHAITLATIEPFVDDDIYTLLSQRTIGELEQISAYWQEQSQISLGEYLASNGSSKNTRRPSSTTSSASGSDSETSAND